MIHTDDPIGHRDGFQLVMGDDQGGEAEAFLKILELRAHGDTECCVKVRKRLVK